MSSDTQRPARTVLTAERDYPSPDGGWHTLGVADTLAVLGSGPEGLGAESAATRLGSVGRNELVDRGTKSPWALLWEQVSAVMVVILLAAAALSLALGKYLEAGSVLAIVVLFVLLGFLQEYRAEQAIAALRKLSSPRVRVVRDGQVAEVDAVDLVPGDLVLVEAGNVVPADIRLVDSANLRVQESTLTGESEPVEKDTDTLTDPGLPLGDRRNLAYMGTQVTYGRGRGVVVATGMDTELGRIATLLQDVEAEDTPLQVRLDAVGKQLALGGVLVSLVIMGMGAIAGESLADLVLTAISVAVAVIPEGLPAVVTFTLAVGSQRMLKRNALVRKLPAVETLGSVTVVCSDKTGTLTENRMTVTVVDVAGTTLRLDRGAPGGPDGPEEGVMAALVVGAVCNDTEISGGQLIGDPTETALVDVALRAGLDVAAVWESMPRREEIPFDSARKRMTTVHRREDVSAQSALAPLCAALGPVVSVALVKGAPDRLLDLATHGWERGEVVALDAEHRRRIQAANDALASDGMRVLGVAVRGLAEGEGVEEAESGLVMVGLIGIIDPPRAEVADAVSVCRRAGVRPVMITGDHPLTAAAIARDLDISRDGEVLTGPELDLLDDEEIADAAERVSVFARVSPEHKLRIVGGLQSRGHVVAMTGDGVNDAPALKRSDIGVAMGITGTDVSKEASDMVLRDDNFATIVAAVEEGRVIYDNLRRFISFAVAGNLGKVIVMLIWPIPLLIGGISGHEAVAFAPLQLLWLNLMTDGLLGLSMGAEPAEKGVMQRPPHSPEAGIFSGGLGKRTVAMGILIGAVSLGVGFVYFALDRPEWQTMMFTTIAFMQVAQAVATRSFTESVFRLGLMSNKVLAGIVVLVVGLQIAALYTPLNSFLGLDRLSAADLGICVLAGLVVLAGVEVWRSVGRSGSRSGPGPDPVLART